MVQRLHKVESKPEKTLIRSHGLLQPKRLYTPKYIEIQGERADNKQEQEDTEYAKRLPSEEHQMP